jgi:hypothetical protein
MFFCEIGLKECVLDKNGISECGDFNLEGDCIWCVCIERDYLEEAKKELEGLDYFGRVVVDGILPIELIIFVDKMNVEREEEIEKIMKKTKENLDLFYVIREDLN